MSETPGTSPSISRRLFCLALSLLLNHQSAANNARALSRDTQPIEDPSGHALLGFYNSLERTFQGEWVTRIVHYGDSHVAADILTGELRRHLQLYFGESGAGFVLPGRPWPGYWRPGLTSQNSAGWQIDGITEASLAADGRLGLAGVSFTAHAPGEWITMTATGSYFGIYALKEPGGGSITVLLDGIEQKHKVSLAARVSEPVCIEIVAETGSVHTIEIQTTSSGRTRIFGIAIEMNSAGVVYDALGINGARATRPLRWDWNVLTGSLQRRDPDLIVVAYGSNEVSDPDLDLHEYKLSFKTMLREFHKAAPRASILVVGPPDRAVRTGHRWKTIDRMSALVEVQRQAAFETGAGFYNLFKAMGGSGSVERWATEQSLAQPDRVHLTKAGYKMVATWLYTELVNGFLRQVGERKL